MSDKHSTDGRLDDAVCYFRMSKDDQENSIERQQGQVYPYAAARGYNIVREYKDEGIAGWKSGLDRPEFNRMLRDAQRGQFKRILCDDVDRFGRFDIHKYGAIVDPLRNAGVRLETVAQGLIDWDDTLSQVNDAIRMVFKREQSNDTARRVLTRFIQLARVRAIFALYLEHQSLLPVVQELARRGWVGKRWQTRHGRSRGGRPFDKTSLYRFLGDFHRSLDPHFEGGRHRGRYTDRERLAWAYEHAADSHVPGRGLGLRYSHLQGEELGVRREIAGPHGAGERLIDVLALQAEDLLDRHDSSLRGLPDTAAIPASSGAVNCT